MTRRIYRGLLWLWLVIVFLLWFTAWFVPELWAQEGGCKDIRINAKGSSGASIAVSTAVVPIADGNTSRCSLTIINEVAQTARCAETTGKYTLTPSSTVGVFIPGVVGATLTLPTVASQQAWSCIRAGGVDTALSVIETLP